MKYLMLLISLAFTAAGIFILWSGRDPQAALSAIFFFGGCSLVAAWECLGGILGRSVGWDIGPRGSGSRALVVRCRVTVFILYGIGSAGLALGGLMLVTSGKAPIVGWFSVLFFGFGALVLLWSVVDPRPRLVIDDEGIVERTLRVRRIRWADIELAYLRSIQAQQFVCLVLRDPEAYLKQLSPLGRKVAKLNLAFGFSELSVAVSDLAVSPEEILQEILRHIESKRGDSGEYHVTATRP